MTTRVGSRPFRNGRTPRSPRWPPAADALEVGSATRDDPQYRSALPYPAVPSVDRIADGDSLRVGVTVAVATLTAGHTPGGTTWSWDSCEGQTCYRIVYADSQTPVSGDGFLFSDASSYPAVLEDLPGPRKPCGRCAVTFW